MLLAMVVVVVMPYRLPTPADQQDDHHVPLGYYAQGIPMTPMGRHRSTTPPQGTLPAGQIGEDHLVVRVWLRLRETCRI